MNKAYLLVICLLLAPFTGCLDEFTDEELDVASDSLEDKTYRECLVPYGKCYGVDFSGHDLSGMNLTGIRFSHTQIPGEGGAADEWIQPNLSGADLSDTDLNDAEFYGIKLSGADLTGANLSGAFITGNCITKGICDGSDHYVALDEMETYLVLI